MRRAHGAVGLHLRHLACTRGCPVDTKLRFELLLELQHSLLQRAQLAGVLAKDMAAGGHPERGLRRLELRIQAGARKGVRLAQKMQVGPCIPEGIQLEKAEGPPTPGPTWRLPHLRSSMYTPLSLASAGTPG